MEVIMVFDVMKILKQRNEEKEEILSLRTRSEESVKLAKDTIDSLLNTQSNEMLTAMIKAQLSIYTAALELRSREDHLLKELSDDSLETKLLMYIKDLDEQRQVEILNALS